MANRRVVGGVLAPQNNSLNAMPSQAGLDATRTGRGRDEVFDVFCLSLLLTIGCFIGMMVYRDEPIYLIFTIGSGSVTLITGFVLYRRAKKNRQRAVEEAVLGLLRGWFYDVTRIYFTCCKLIAGMKEVVGLKSNLTHAPSSIQEDLNNLPPDPQHWMVHYKYRDVTLQTSEGVIITPDDELHPGQRAEKSRLRAKDLYDKNSYIQTRAKDILEGETSYEIFLRKNRPLSFKFSCSICERDLRGKEGVDFCRYCGNPFHRKCLKGEPCPECKEVFYFLQHPIGVQKIKMDLEKKLADLEGKLKDRFGRQIDLPYEEREHLLQALTMINCAFTISSTSKTALTAALIDAGFRAQFLQAFGEYVVPTKATVKKMIARAKELTKDHKFIFN